MTRLQTCSLIVLGSLIRCSTNSMSYPSYSHPPSSPSSFAPQVNSNYRTLVNSAPSAHCVSALYLLACSMRAVSGTMPMWVLQMAGRLCWISLGWVRLVMFIIALINSPVLFPQQSRRIHTITHATSSARSSHYRSFSRCYDYCVRSYLCARGDKCGHPGHTRPNTFKRSHVYRPTHSFSVRGRH